MHAHNKEPKEKNVQAYQACLSTIPYNEEYSRLILQVHVTPVLFKISIFQPQLCICMSSLAVTIAMGLTI